MRPLGIVTRYPSIHIFLQLLDRTIQLAAERAGIELILDGLVKALADAVRLRMFCLRARVVNVLEIQVEHIFMRFPVATVLTASVRKDAQQWYVVFLGRTAALDH